MRNSQGRFIIGHQSIKESGFKKGNKYGLGKHHNKGKNLSPKTEFKKGQIAWNKGISHSIEMRMKLKMNHKGMTGKKRSKEFCEMMSRIHTGRIMSVEARKRMSVSKINFIMNNPGRGYVQSKGGKRIINGREQYFRSRWEANTARILDLQKREWEYETKQFWFNKIKRGTRCYIPDFYLPKEDMFIEVKGWMDQKSLTKMKRMAKYYPNIKIEIWNGDTFKVFKKQGMHKLIKDWE